MTEVIIARHGNTFLTGEVPRRVGARSDIPLVPSGKDQAIRLGKELRRRKLSPDLVLSAPLLRSHETAEIVRGIASPQARLLMKAELNEIDHGPDEDQEEEKVIERIGKSALEAWNAEAKMPADWSPRPDKLRQEWSKLLADIANEQRGSRILMVTSNGRARFVPLLPQVHKSPDLAEITLKLSTGAFGRIVLRDDNQWNLVEWNTRP